MRDLYEQSIDKISEYFYKLDSKVDRPRKVKFSEFYVYRYSERNIYEAMIQKSARVITCLKSIYLLNKAGFVQEQASLQRVHDELTEDILFLAFAIIFDKFTDKHKRYLDAFYEDDISSLEKSEKAKATLPRQKIRAYINSFNENDPSTGIQAGKDISRTYSGYVHGASPQIMELYYGNPPYFHVSGSNNSPLYNDHVEDLLNYFYRSIMNFAFVAKAFGDEELFNEVHTYSKKFAIESGEPDKLTEYV